VDYKGPQHPLTEEQIEAISERAADKALAKVYENIGRSIVNKAMWIVGAGVLALLAWLGGKGLLK
jgi:hypothetical protein